MTCCVWILTAFAAFGGFMFGYDIGVINGVKEMDGFRQTFNLSGSNESQCYTDVQESTILGLIVSVFSIGCLLGALLAGGVADWIGRKTAIIIGGVIFIIGGALQSVAFFIWMIMLGRIIAGIGVGILSMVVPIYNAELAPKSLRGRLVSLNQLAITAGIMVSFITAVWTETFEAGWRVAFGLQCVFGVILSVGMLFLPETPRWLVRKQKDDKALLVLTRLRNSSPEEIQDELNEIRSSIKSYITAKSTIWSSFRALLNWKIAQRLLIGIVLQLLQQFTGMNVVMYYSTSIFGQLGVSEYISTAVVGMINFLATIVAIFLVDKVGRKSLLLLGGIGMFVAMLAAATFILAFGLDTSNCENVSNEVGAVGYVVVFFICFFVFNFAYSWGPVTWVVTSEIFPLQIRGTAVSITTAANWFGNFIIAMLTPVLIASPLRIFGTFYIVCVALLVGVIFVLLTLPETKGRSLERVDNLFLIPWLERTDIFYYLRLGCFWNCKKSEWYRPNRLLETEKMTTESHSNEDQTLLLHSEEDTVKPRSQ